MSTLDIILEYPLSPSREIEFKGICGSYVYESSKNEQWFRCNVIKCDLPKFNRIYKKVLVYELTEMLKYKHVSSRCTVVEDLICQLNS